MQTSVFSVHSSLLHMKLTVNTLPSPILVNGGLGEFNFNKSDWLFNPIPFAIIYLYEIIFFKIKVVEVL